jgi:hypothetical protein
VAQVKDEETDDGVIPPTKQWLPEASIIHPISGDIKLTD